MEKVPAMRALVAGLIWLVTTPVLAQTARPTAADIDVAMQRSFGYDPAVTWKVLDVEPSDIAGLTEALVSINGKAPNRLFVSADGKAAIVGDVIPFGPDPFAQARARLVAAAGPARGGSAITLVVFTDFECVHCKAAHPVLDKLAADFPEVRQVVVEFPLPASLDPWATTAARVGDCVARTDAKAFWPFADAVFASQGDIAAATAEARLLDLAAAVGLNRAAVAACASAPQTAERVQASLAFGQSLKVDQAPTVFLNGRRVLGLADIPYENLKQLVRFEIDHANR